MNHAQSTPDEAINMIVDTSTTSFAADVIEASRERLVLVDFWAPWCGPCKQLTPVLEKIITETKGGVKLAKMNIDEHPQIAQQLQVQSIPSVFAFKNGQPVDGFMGALPESELRKFIEKNLGTELGPSEIEKLLTTGEGALKSGDFSRAVEVFSKVLDLEGENISALTGLAKAYIAIDAGDAAREILACVPVKEANNPEVLALMAHLKLAEKTENTGDKDELLSRLSQNENDHQARFDLALIHHGAKRREEAINCLLFIIEKQPNWNEDAARKQLIELFDAYGATDEVTLNGRRRLASFLFK